MQTSSDPTVDLPLGNRTTSQPAGDVRTNTRWAVVAVLGVALLYVAAQGVLFPLSDFYMGRDEAIYLSQVAVGEPALDLAVHRTRGMSILLAPIALFVGHSMLILRGYMVLLGGVGIFLAFRPWARTIGWGAPLGALVFAGWWVNLLFGAQLYPNFAVAVAAVATAGHFVTYMRDQDRRSLAAAAVWIAIMAFLRPIDSVLVSFGLWVGMLLFWRRLFVPVTVAMAAGGILGFAPWFIEGWIRFGLTPLERLSVSRPAGIEVPNLLVFLNNTDGPVRCVLDCKYEYLANPGLSMSWPEAVVLLGLFSLSTLGLLRSPRWFTTKALYVAGLAAASLFYFYLTCTCAVNLRYLQPAFGLVALLVGAGLLAAWRLAARVPFGPALQVGLVVVLLLSAGYEANLANDSINRGVNSRERAFLLSEILNEHAAGEPCAAATAVSDRQIQYFSDCLAVRLNRRDNGLVQYSIGGSTSTYDLGLLAGQGYRIFAVARPRHVPDKSPIRDWEVTDISNKKLGQYRLFTAPAGVEIETEYKRGYTQEDADAP